jgi:hypothetical protein
MNLNSHLEWITWKVKESGWSLWEFMNPDENMEKFYEPDEFDSKTN